MKKIFYIVGGLVLIGVLGFAYYAISPLFITIELDESLPEASVEMQDESATTTGELASASVVGTVGHPASGTARVVETDDGTYIRYEDFKTINGPSLYVYLSNDLEATEFVDLGPIRATEGNVNYEVPAGVDVSNYRYVLVWCRPFGVLFNYADLAQTE